MHKIIISNLEIDLTIYQISFNEENSWFSDSFYSKYTYPFNLLITPELNKLLGNILSFDSASGLYFLDVQYVFYNKIEKAVLIIEEISDSTVSVSLKYGTEEFPNFDKNLSDFDFPLLGVSNIYNYANLTVGQTYPSVDFNFPQIHTDKYDVSDVQFNGFKKIINNRINGTFIQNTVDNDEMMNYNIMQPLPYVLYVLHKCFEYSGYQMVGDILEDNLLKKLMIFTETDYFENMDSSPLELNLSSFDVTEEDYLSDPSRSLHITSQKSIQINQAGKYNVIGEITLTPVGPAGYQVSMFGYLDVKVVGTNITNRIFYNKVSWEDQTFFIDLNFEVPLGQEIILLFWIDGIYKENAVWCDLQVFPMYYLDSSGRKLANLINSNTINIAKALPKITFGSLVTTILNWFNYDVDLVENNKIVINKIQNSFKTNEILDFRNFENTSVKRNIKNGTNFHFKYSDEGDSDFGGVFMDSKGSIQTTKDFSKTIENQIQIDCVPLKNELIDVVNTAKAIGVSDDKVCFVLYDGLIGDQNFTQDSNELSVHNIFNTYHYEWIYNRIHSHEYTMTFIAPVEVILNLNSKKRLYFFNNLHVIKSITKNQISKDWFQIELETEHIKL